MDSPTDVPTSDLSAPSGLIRDREQAEGYVAMVCFKHGPPTLHGVELEWTVHHRDDPARPLDADHLAAALGAFAPTTLAPGSPHDCLSGGSLITVEPGGQVEVSAPPSPSLSHLIGSVSDDAAAVADLLDDAGLVVGQHGLDPHRPPHRLLQMPRYAAMQAAFEPLGPAGSQMMCSSASMQVCLDAGEGRDIPLRWQAVHALGPPLLALFANSSHHDGRDTGWKSARIRATLGTCPPVTEAPSRTDDPAARWATLAMTAPVICICGPGTSWQAPRGLTFAGWIEDPRAVGRPPTVADLDYHLSTLFPPVRPKGYLEVRYLDAQPGPAWIPPLVLLSALMARPETVDRVLDVTAATTGRWNHTNRWYSAGRRGLDDPALRRVATALVTLGSEAMCHLDLDAATLDAVAGALETTLVPDARRRCPA